MLVLNYTLFSQETDTPRLAIPSLVTTNLEIDRRPSGSLQENLRSAREWVISWHSLVSLVPLILLVYGGGTGRPVRSVP